MRLIDVRECCVCEVDLPCRYTCLSYVWGDVDQPQNVESLRGLMEQPGGLSNNSIKLPKTIRDAMEVMQWLDVQYLWVDALCIEQDNDLDVRSNISNMSTIYRGAALTIVASSNSSPLEGLPGVTSVQRSAEQIRKTIQGIGMAVQLHDSRLPVAEIKLSTWNIRGWTYQEHQLSRRVVFFTELQMVFQCSQAICYEDAIPPSVHNDESMPLNDYPGALAGQRDIIRQVWWDPTQAEYKNKSFVTDGGTVTGYGEHLDMSKDAPKPRAPLYEHAFVARKRPYDLLHLFDETFWIVYRQAVAS